MGGNRPKNKKINQKYKKQIFLPPRYLGVAPPIGMETMFIQADSYFFFTGNWNARFLKTWPLMSILTRTPFNWASPFKAGLVRL